MYVYSNFNHLTHRANDQKFQNNVFEILCNNNLKCIFKNCFRFIEKLWIEHREFQYIPHPIQFLQLLICCVKYGTLLFQLLNKVWWIIIWKSPHFIWMSLVFNLMPFSFPGSHSRYYIIFSCHASIALWQFLRFTLFVFIFTVLRCTSLVFCRIPLDWDSCGIFIMQLWLFIWEKEVHSLIVITPYKKIQSAWLFSVNVDLIHLAMVVLVNFL